MKKIILFVLFFLAMYTNSFAQTLHIYGGQNQNEYLGCLNCDNYDQNSIWNKYGTYGNKYNSQSIWNKYGTFGSKYNSYSPWNTYSYDSPIVLDSDGNFHGYFTLNKYKDDRANFELAVNIYEYYDIIRDDVSNWYKKLFN